MGNVTRGVPGVLVSERNNLIFSGASWFVSTTWYLNKTRIRTWDHFPVVVKIFDGREMRVRKGRKGWAVWTPVSEDEERKFKELCLCPECRVLGVTMMRLVAWRLCRRGWEELLWRSRILQ